MPEPPWSGGSRASEFRVPAAHPRVCSVGLRYRSVDGELLARRTDSGALCGWWLGLPAPTDGVGSKVPAHGPKSLWHRSPSRRAVSQWTPSMANRSSGTEPSSGQLRPEPMTSGITRGGAVLFGFGGGLELGFRYAGSWPCEAEPGAAANTSSGIEVELTSPSRGSNENGRSSGVELRRCAGRSVDSICSDQRSSGCP